MNPSHKRRLRAKNPRRARLTEAEFRALEANLARKQGREPGGAPEAKPSKMRNKRVTIGERTFASMREADRFVLLSAAQDAGEITELQCQVRFVLAPAVDIGEKRKKPALRYFADFVYVVVKTGVYGEAGQTIVEDSKGFQTRAYRDRKHLMKTVHGIDIREV
ncbi:DUF1064 domain-containing protein [Paraburkholderia sp. C35]|uniref:DUF1064 domain-containing protein n=1 Tax=Paraburkholderia sp. C35 TaxID=2126993 RepID=UPI000D692EA5|nr:DUF1064 domain-containing protein [Paraburkholderia sp. C35]